MADLDRVKRNVAKMVQQNAPGEDIDSYLSGEGVTTDQVKAHKLGASAPTAPAKAPDQPNMAMDVLKSTATGLGKGIAYTGSAPGLVPEALGWAMRKIGIPTRDTSQPLPSNVTVPYPQGDYTKGFNDTIQSAAGEYHKSETVPGQYAETIASFAPAAFAGAGGIGRRILRTGAAAVGSETGGQLTQGTEAEPYARIIGAIAAGGAPRLATGAIRSINAAVVKRGGPAFLDPAKTAEEKIREAVQNDGGVDQVGRNTVAWANSGASGPTLIDVGGNNVRRLVRGAASGGSGQAQNVATDYAGGVRANFQDTVLDHTRGLTPDISDSATVYGEKLAQGQKDVAATKYAGPYAQPAQVTPELVSALQGPEGASAIRQAWLDARANRNLTQMGELKDLEAVASEQGATADIATGKRRTLAQALGGLTAGALDRVRIAMRDTGRGLAAAGRNSRAGGYFDRVKDIDTALDQTPGLQPARLEYRQMQAGRDALDLGAAGLSTPSADYATAITRFAGNAGGPANVGRPAQVGMRQALINKLETGADGATGPAKTISQAARVTENMGQTFGPERTARYQTAVGNEVKRVGNADFISPNTGSQTQLRTGDEGLLAGVPTSKAEFFSKVIDTLRGRGATLTDAERTLIVRMGTTEADLRRLAQQNPRMGTSALAQIAAVQSSKRQ